MNLDNQSDRPGLTDFFGIELDQDLQKDAECFEPTATLLGALAEISKQVDKNTLQQQKLLWATRGKVLMKK